MSVTHTHRSRIGFCQLGNVLFQISATIAYARKHGMDYFSPKDEYSHYFPKLKIGVQSNFPEYKEPCFEYKEIPYMPNVRLTGFWQSEKYFENCKDEILDLFGAGQGGFTDTIALHNRLGDYKTYSDRFTVLGEDYFAKAMSIFYSRGYTKFLVFSDGMEETKAMLNSEKYPHLEFIYSAEKDPYKDMRIGSACAGNIISASSFSWWQAYLNTNPDRIVVAPKKWFPHDELNYKDVVPENWIKI